MNNKKKVILTFDYELFLGKDSGTAQKCIIEPTDIILDLLSRYKAKAIFFVDTTYLLKLKETNHKDLKIIKEQIFRIIKSGHDVELHLHPQWLDAYKTSENRWGFKSFNKYSLHSLNKKEISRIFKDSIKFLEEIIHKIDKKYKVTAFRAGGWAIQPFDAIKKYFDENNIVFDFSVNPGLYSKSGTCAFYNFCNTDTDLDFWRFNDDPCMPEKNGKFIEIPVSTLKVKKIDLWLNYYLYKKHEKQSGDGNSIEIKEKKSLIVKKIFNILNIFSLYYFALSVDGLSNKYFIKFLKKYDKKNKNYITIVLHPKQLSKNSIKNLEYLLKNYKTTGLNELREVID